MSNVYINKILFGVSNNQVNSEYVQDLLPFMLTETKLNKIQSNVVLQTDNEPTHKENNQNVQPEQKRVNTHSPISTLISPIRSRVCDPLRFGIAQFVEPKKNRYNHQRNSLFWAIYEIENPAEAFLGTKANAEVEHRLKVVASLKSTPKRLKETNSKLTIEQTQALIGSMLVAKEDKLEFCIAYAVYYKKLIIVVHNKTYCVFSPMIDIDLETEDAIILYAVQSETSNQIIYTSEKNPTREMIHSIIETKIMGPLKSISNYKVSELDDIATKLQISTTHSETNGKEKRRKKEDIYNDIKVLIHSDQVPSYKPTISSEN